MAYDERHGQLLREELAGLSGIIEKTMFSDLCFLLNGNMICGVHRNGGMARVGKELEGAALELDGVEHKIMRESELLGVIEK